MDLAQAIAAELPEIEEIRHDLHAHPELGYQEVRTSGVVQRELTRLGVKHVPGLAGGTGVLALIPATVPSARTIALRADMDALPIVENTGLPYSSTHEGRMHACGHDGHTSILLGAARVLSKLEERPNHVLLLFQPAEEGGGGGKKMVDDGALAGTVLGNRADMIFGLHGYPGMKVGQIATRVGAMMASADGFEILVTGKGGHAAMPHMGIDPVVVASHIVTALQTIASRNVKPLDSVVVTIGKIVAGTASNIIPDTALLVGTLRTLNEATRHLAMRRIDEIASGVAAAFGAKAELSFNYGYPVTCNDASAVARLRETLGPVFGDALSPDEVEPVMGAEDFSFYGAECPACFYWLGLLGETQEQYPNLHAPEFDFNDKALPVGMRAMCELALAR
ncbi:MAG: amidohydrolase [Fimbriimonadaceae bacterium]|nr:amidohydrolase [Fimbriimonadaceae bacterium]